MVTPCCGARHDDVARQPWLIAGKLSAPGGEGEFVAALEADFTARVPDVSKSVSPSPHAWSVSSLPSSEVNAVGADAMVEPALDGAEVAFTAAIAFATALQFAVSG